MQKTVVMNSGTWRNDNGNNHFNGGVTLNGNSIMTVGAGATLNQLGVIDGGGSLIKNNTGTLVLAGANTYGGATMVNAGTLGLLNSGSIAGSSGITLASGSILNAATRTDGTLTLASGQTLSGSGAVHGNVVSGTGTGISPGFSAGTLTVTNALSLSDATLTYELSGATTEGAGVNDLINVGGALTLGGLTTVKVLPVGPLVVGTPYTLMNYVGALSGNMLNLNPVSDSRHSFAVDTLTTPGKVLLTPGGASESLEWVGGEFGAERLWDLKTTANWLALNVEQFYAGDVVRFNDLALEFNVDLVGDLYAGGTLFENDVENYTVGGTGRLHGGSLTKINGGRVVLANTGLNDYPGPTVISAGTLQVGNGGAFGNLGPNTITNNATLVLQRSDNQTFANTMTGTGTLRKEGANQLSLGASLAGFDGTIAATGGTLLPTAATAFGTIAGGTVLSGGATLQINGINFGAEPFTVAGSLLNNAAGQNNAFRFVTLSGDTTVGGTGRFDIRANPTATLAGNGFRLTKTGVNQVSLVDVGDSGLGDIDVQQGVLSVELSSGLGLPTGTVNVQSGATLLLWGSTVAQDKKFALNGGARIFKDNGVATIIGTGSLTGSNAVEAASNAGTDLTLGGVVSGPGSLNKLGAGFLFLTANNDYSGGTMVSAGSMSLGNGGTSGNVQGPIVNNAALFVRRSDAVTLNGNITGTGTLGVRSPVGMTVPSGVSILLNGSIQVGQDFAGKMIVEDGAVVSTGGQLLLGNPTSIPGEVTQTGGDVWVALDARIGHWPTETSTYIMGGGTLNLTNVPTGAAAERNGILYIGVDGTGIFTQTGGVARAHGLVLDNRGETPGVDTMNLEGGRFIVGPSGIGRGNPTNTSYLINLGGGTIGSSANWTSVLNMTLTGINGDATLDTAANSVWLTGVLSGPGGIKKEGAGTLTVQGANTHAGTTLVNNGTLNGTGSFTGPVVVAPGGTLAPGLSIGTMTVANSLSLSGATVMEINKTGATRTSDRVLGITALTYGGTLTVQASGDALAVGDTFDLFDAAAFTGEFVTLNLPALAPGLVWETCGLTVDGTIRVGSQNLAPVAQENGITTLEDRPVSVWLQKLLLNDSDPENDTLTVVAVSATSPNGAVVSLTSSNVTYSPALGFTGTDQFTYTVSDGRCGFATATVQVFVADGDLPSGNQVSLQVMSGGVRVRFAGVPGRDYIVERASTLSPADWTPLATLTAPAHGILEYFDTSPTQPSAFYRTRLP
jgi:fibronectin-binding autotransporter adhesin